MMRKPFLSIKKNVAFLTILTLVIFFVCKNLTAQVDTTAISKIKIYIKYIDSLSMNDDRQKFIVNSIAEGPIRQEIMSISPGGNNKKADTIRTTKSGGFGKYTTENLSGDTVYKINYHDNLNKNFYEFYYYHHNILVYAKIDYREDGIGKTFYFREEFYKDNEILLVNESTVPIDNMFKERVSFDLRAAGKGYFDKFQASSR